MKEKKQFCIPIYLEDRIKFKDCYLEVNELIRLVFEDLLTYAEIAAILTERAGVPIGISAIAKALKHYSIEIDDDTKKKRAAVKAKKAAAALQEKYGVSNVFQLESIKKKSEQTKISRYGDPHFINQPKMQATSLERYGVANYSSTKECREKIKATNMQKFGTVTPAQNPEILQKMKDTCTERYDADNYWKSEKFKKEQQQAYFDKYPQLTAEYKDAYKDPEKLKAFIATLEDKTSKGIAERFGVSYASVNALLSKYELSDIKEILRNTSHYEQELIDFIGVDLCKANDRTVLDGSEIDIYIPTKKLGIEFNGTYWHSIACKPDKNYHLNKSKLAEEKGIRLIHIYEYEWKDPVQREKVKLMLNIALGRVSTKLYARQCTVKQIDNAEAKALNEKVHLQGHRDAQVTYGLFYAGELVQLMSFSHTHYNKNLEQEDSWEIIRGCPASNNIVIGGVSRLFSHFVREYHPSMVFSYCDFNKFDGKSYEELGMSFIGYTGPDMKWIMPDGTVRNRSPRHHKQLKEASIGQIYGAGSKKYIINF